MDFSLNGPQLELAELSRRILRDKCTPERLHEVEAGGDRFDPALWAALARAGILAAAIPEALGGSGLGLLEQCSVLTEIGRAVAPFRHPGPAGARGAGRTGRAHPYGRAGRGGR
jgi:alkylation response protein AidB-like acyl-CoA dehydrogenase